LPEKADDEAHEEEATMMTTKRFHARPLVVFLRSRGGAILRSKGATEALLAELSDPHSRALVVFSGVDDLTRLAAVPPPPPPSAPPPLSSDEETAPSFKTESSSSRQSGGGDSSNDGSSTGEVRTSAAMETLETLSRHASSGNAPPMPRWTDGSSSSDVGQQGRLVDTAEMPPEVAEAVTQLLRQLKAAISDHVAGAMGKGGNGSSSSSDGGDGGAGKSSTDNAETGEEASSEDEEDDEDDDEVRRHAQALEAALGDEQQAKALAGRLASALASSPLGAKATLKDGALSIQVAISHMKFFVGVNALNII